MFLNNKQVTEEIKREIKKFLETNDNENTTTHNLWGAAKAVSKRQVYSNTYLPQETRKTWIYNLNSHLKQVEKEEQQQKAPQKLVEGKKS